MSTAMDIITNITGFIIYFAPGYVYLCCFYYCAYIQREDKIDHIIIKSIALSYLLFVSVKIVGNVLSIADDVLVQGLTFLSAIILGCVVGTLYRSKIVNKASSILFRRELSRNIYVAINDEAIALCRTAKKDEKNIALEPSVFLHIVMNDDSVYDGQIDKIYSSLNDPIVALAYYTYYDKNGDEIDNKVNVDNAKVFIKDSKIKWFAYEIVIVAVCDTGNEEYICIKPNK